MSAQSYSIRKSGIFGLPEGGWVHVLTPGDWWNQDAGITQVIDDESLTGIAQTFETEARGDHWPGLLVDFDHFSHDKDHETRAAGWVRELQRRGNDLWARIDWTGSGRTAVEQGDYRLVSPVLTNFVPVDGDERRQRPGRLSRLALTNDPNIKGMIPVNNRAPSATQEHTMALQQPMDPKAILCELLGLPPEATDDQIMAKVEELRKLLAEEKQEPEHQAAPNPAPNPAQGKPDGEVENRDPEVHDDSAQTQQEEDEVSQEQLEAQNRRIEELETALAARQEELDRRQTELLDRDLAEFTPMVGPDPAVRGALRNLMAANRGDAITVLTAAKRIAANTARGAKTPIYDPTKAPAADIAGAPQRTDADAAVIATRAREIMARNRCPFPEAWRLAAKESAEKTAGKPSK